MRDLSVSLRSAVGSYSAASISNNDAIIASMPGLVAWFDAVDSTSVYDGLSGEGGASDANDPVGVWIGREGQGGKTVAQILAGASGAFDNNGDLVVANVPTSVMTAPSTGAQPTWLASGAMDFDGSDDSIDLDFAGGSGPANADIFVVMKTSDTQFILVSDRLLDGVKPYALIGHQASTGPTSYSFGTPTMHVNNGSAIANRGAFYTVASTGQKVLAESRGTDLSVRSEMKISGYSSAWEYDGEISAIIIADASAAGYDRDALRTAIASKYGITLS